MTKVIIVTYYIFFKIIFDYIIYYIWIFLYNYYYHDKMFDTRIFIILNSMPNLLINYISIL